LQIADVSHIYSSAFSLPCDVAQTIASARIGWDSPTFQPKEGRTDANKGSAPAEC
jgi:hypothetical protein